MRRVIVWRHGQTEHNAGGVYQGQLDTHLSQVGRLQVREAAALLAERGVGRLLASDLSRATETAQALAAATGVRIEPDSRLREINVGEWQGLTHPEVLAGYPHTQAALERGEDVPRGVTGETVAQVAARMREVFDEVVDTLPVDGVAVLASHGMASRALVAHVVGLDFHAAGAALVGLHNARWAELVEHASGWRLEAWNAGVLGTPGALPD